MVVTKPIVKEQRGHAPTRNLEGQLIPNHRYDPNDLNHNSSNHRCTKKDCHGSRHEDWYKAWECVLPKNPPENDEGRNEWCKRPPASFPELNSTQQNTLAGSNTDTAVDDTAIESTTPREDTTKKGLRIANKVDSFLNEDKPPDLETVEKQLVEVQKLEEKMREESKKIKAEQAQWWEEYNKLETVEEKLEKLTKG